MVSITVDRIGPRTDDCCNIDPPESVDKNSQFQVELHAQIPSPRPVQLANPTDLHTGVPSLAGDALRRPPAAGAAAVAAEAAAAAAVLTAAINANCSPNEARQFTAHTMTQSA